MQLPQAQVTPTLQRYPAAMNAAVNAFLAYSRGLSGSSGGPSVIKLSGIKGFPLKGAPFSIDFASLLGPVFFM